MKELSNIPMNPHKVDAATLAALEAADPDAFGSTGDPIKGGEAPAAAVATQGAPAGGSSVSSVVQAAAAASAAADAAAATEAAGGAAAAPAAAAEPAAVTAPEGQVQSGVDAAGKPIFIPKERFDEVNNDNKAKDLLLAEKDRQLAEASARIAELTAPAAAPPRDFDAEFAALQQKFEDGELDRAGLSAASRALQKEETTYLATQIAAQTIQADKQAQAEAEFQKQWAAADAQLAAAQPELMALPAAKATLQTALEVVDKQTNYTLNPAQLFERAAPVAAAMLGTTLKAPAGGAPAPAAAADPHAARNAMDARAQAAGSSFPAAPTGGAGDRGVGTTVDMSTLKQGDFGKLSKADQDRALGLIPQ